MSTRERSLAFLWFLYFLFHVVAKYRTLDLLGCLRFSLYGCSSVCWHVKQLCVHGIAASRLSSIVSPQTAALAKAPILNSRLGGIYHLQLLPLLGATLKQFLPQDIHHGKITNIPHVIHIGHLRFLRQAIQEAANFIAARFESLFELRYPRILRNCVGSFQSSSNLDLEQRGFLCSTSDGMWRLKVRLSPPGRRYIALRCN